jgi:exoribonuclease R
MRRGQTLYAPDARTPLHPVVLSEDAASLLPDVDRQAFVWRFDLDATGEVAGLELVRALVRSRRRLDYQTVQAAADSGSADAVLAEQAGLLKQIGTLRLGLELARGGASLPLPDQEVSHAGGRYRVRFAPPLPAEDWNAQISLMTGMAAARLMLGAGAGVLRTMPPPEAGAVEYLRRRARALGVPWPDARPYGEFVRALDPARPEQLALLHAAGMLFRGAGYTPFDGAAPAEREHAAVAAPYAHVTAPLRRLVDRFGLVASHAAHHREPVPDWVRAALPQLPAVMQESDRLAGELERRCLDTVEAAVLSGRVGEDFDAIVVDTSKNGDGGRVQVADPAVLARCDGSLELGEAVRVRLVAADVDTATVRFARR